MTEQARRPPDVTGAYIEVCLRRLTLALEEADPLRRYALQFLARADVGATCEQAMVSAHEASGVVSRSGPDRHGEPEQQRLPEAVR